MTTADASTPALRDRMTFGLFMAPHHRIGENPTLAMQRHLDVISQLDQLGYDEVWVGEHHSGGWEFIGSPEVVIAAAAQRTRSIKLGTGVVSLPYHHPLIVADRMLQLDHLTQGRAILGVGPGALASDASMLGIDPVTQRRKMDESLGVILRLLRGEVVTHDSDWFSLRDARLQMRGYTEPHLPVVVASTISPSGTTAAGKYGLDVISLGGFIGQPVIDLADQWAIAERAAQEHGQTVDRAGWRVVIPFYIAPTREEAIVQASEGCRRFLVDYIGGTVGHHIDAAQMEATLHGEGAAIIGSPDDAIAAIERLQDVTGGFGGFVGLFHEWAGPQEMTRNYELFARYVMPHFQGLIDPLQRSQQWLASRNTEVFGLGPDVMRAAFQDAGVELPDALRPTPSDD